MQINKFLSLKTTDQSLYLNVSYIISIESPKTGGLDEIKGVKSIVFVKNYYSEHLTSLKVTNEYPNDIVNRINSL